MLKLSNLFASSSFLTCPEYEFNLTPFTAKVCEQSSVFKYFEYYLPSIPLLGKFSFFFLLISRFSWQINYDFRI